MGEVRGDYRGVAPVRTPGLAAHIFRSTNERKVVNRSRPLTVLAGAAAALLIALALAA